MDTNPIEPVAPSTDEHIPPLHRPLGVRFLALIPLALAISNFGTAVVVLPRREQVWNALASRMDATLLPAFHLENIGFQIHAAQAISILLALFFLVYAWGLWTFRGWAQAIAIFHCILGILSVFNGNLVYPLVAASALIFLTRPRVSAAFGRQRSS